LAICAEKNMQQLEKNKMESGAPGERGWKDSEVFPVKYVY